MVARAGRELAVAQSPQLAAQRLWRDGDAELVPDPLDEVDETPAHHPVHGRDRPLIENALQRSALGVVQPRHGSGRAAGEEPLRPLGIEAQHPVAHGLQADGTDTGRL